MRAEISRRWLLASHIIPIKACMGVELMIYKTLEAQYRRLSGRSARGRRWIVRPTQQACDRFNINTHFEPRPQGPRLVVDCIPTQYLWIQITNRM